MKKERITWTTVRKALRNKPGTGFFVGTNDMGYVLRENNGGYITRKPRVALEWVEHWDVEKGRYVD